MTTRVRIEILEGNHNVIVNECEERLGGADVKTNSHTLAPGQKVELYVWGNKYLNVGEEKVAT